MKSKLTVFLLAIFIVMALMFAARPEAGAASTKLKIGDYVQFGQYYNEPILWRVINIDNEGDPLLFAAHVLCLKAFDAAGDAHADQGDHLDNRRLHGSSYWRDANIRQWLNSSEQRINWAQNVPSAENIKDGHNPYDQEKGFLAGHNFSQPERNAIKPVTHKALLAEPDKHKSSGGSEIHTFYEWSDGVTQNYDEAFYENVTDQVFLLSVKEMEEYIYDRNWSDWARPTAGAVSNSTYKSNVYAVWQFDPARNWRYWLRTPVGPRLSRVREAGISSGIVLSDQAFVGTGGIRPALYLKMSAVNLASGTGAESSPYVAQAGPAINTGAVHESVPSQWAAPEIEAARNYGLTTEKVLSDYQKPITREEFCELAVKLYEALSGQKAWPAAAGTFVDTGSQEILKAYQLGIVGGVGNSQFAPGQLVTREQIAVMFKRTMAAAVPSLPPAAAPAPVFADGSLISGWAREAVADMGARGIIGGVGANKFDPQGNATREQAVALVKRVYEQMKNR